MPGPEDKVPELIYFATLAGETESFEVRAEDVRWFQNRDSRQEFAGDDGESVVLWGAPRLWGLPGGRWVLDEDPGKPAEVMPQRALRWCFDSRNLREWPPGGPLAGKGPPRLIPGPPPELVRQVEAERWQPSEYFCRGRNPVKPGTLNQAAYKTREGIETGTPVRSQKRGKTLVYLVE